MIAISPDVYVTKEFAEFAKKTMREWMLREMSDLSETHWCAGWIGGTEDVLWDAIERLPEKTKWCECVINVGMLNKLKQCRDFLGEWVVWRGATGKTVVSIAQYLAERNG